LAKALAIKISPPWSNQSGRIDSNANAPTVGHALKRMISPFGWKKLRPVLAVVVLLPGLYAQTTSENINAISSALRGREFDKALQLVEPALKEFPKSPQLWMLKGLAYAGKGNQKAALASYQSALKNSPDYLPALEGAAQLEYDAGNPSAIPLLEHVLRLQPNDPTSHAMLAVLAYKKHNCVSAAPHFAQSGALLDSQPGALQMYGSCLMALKQTDKAIPIFGKMLALHPDDPRTRRNMAAVQLAAHEPQEAIATLQPALIAGNPEANTLQLAAAAYEANQDTPNAVKILRDAIVKDPRNVSLYVDFANIAMTHQSFQTGIDVVNSGLNLQPKAAELYLARGVLYVQMAAFDKAEADFEKAEQLDPQQSLSAAAQGMVAEEKNQNNPDEALATVRAKLAKKPSDAFLWYLQAAILAQKAPAPGSPDFQRAIQSANKAVSLQPSLVAARDVLAKLYLQSAQNALAIKECRLALQNDPSDQTALYHLVLALRKSNHRSEIPELLKRLAQARQSAAKEEAEQNRYKLMVDPSPSTSAQPAN
jgi:tetratricopeptide (TPR) repeat protein